MNSEKLTDEIWLLPVSVDDMSSACYTTEKDVADSAQWAYKYVLESGVRKVCDDLADDMFNQCQLLGISLEDSEILADVCFRKREDFE